MAQLTIRNVPDYVRDELAARAARRRQSMQEYLLSELERMVAKPPVEAWVERVRAHKAALGVTLTAEEILEARDADRK